MRSLLHFLWALAIVSCSGASNSENPWPPATPRQPERLNLASPNESDSLVWWHSNIYVGLANYGEQDAQQQKYVQTVFSESNRIREENGVATVEMLESLNSVAQAHALDLATRDYWAHQTAEGLSSRQRIMAATGLVVTVGGENTAFGFSGTESAEYIVRNWEHHSGHRDLLLNPDVEFMGSGVAQFSSGGPLFITQLLISFNGS